MATQVQICNLALAKLGDEAQVTGIAPSDGSMQANYCALFYPQALNVLLSKHAWSFATVTAATSATANFVSGGGSGAAALIVDNATGIAPGMWASGANLPNGAVVAGVSAATNLVTLSGSFSGAAGGPYAFTFLNGVNGVNGANNNPLWAYSYNLPADYFKLIELRDQASGASIMGRGPEYDALFSFEPYVRYAIEAGTLYSNDSNLSIVYLSNLYMAESNFTPLFTEALAVLLASYLAGPLLKGDVGVAAQQKMLQNFAPALKMAVEADGEFRRARPRFVPAGIRARV